MRVILREVETYRAEIMSRKLKLSVFLSVATDKIKATPLPQQRTNCKCQDTQATEFCTVAPKSACGSSE
jgi:hypothetical protein